MKRITTICLAVAVAVGVAAPAEAHYGNPGSKRCRDISFTPQSDNGAFQIKARNIPCKIARRWIRHGNGGWRDVPDRFACSRRDHYEGLAHTNYRCSDTRSSGEFEKLTWADY